MKKLNIGTHLITVLFATFFAASEVNAIYVGESMIMADDKLQTSKDVVRNYKSRDGDDQELIWKGCASEGGGFWFC